MSKYDVPENGELHADREKDSVERKKEAGTEGAELRIEKTPEVQERRDVDRAHAEGIKSQLQEELRKPDNGRYGDFSSDDVAEDGYLHIPKNEVTRVKEQIGALKKRATIATLATGTRIAAEYDITVNNFSTYTSVIHLSDGRKAFAVYAHPGSTVHRALDGVMKHLAGLRMGKVGRSQWKHAFEEHARIPLFECKDPHTVLMPYLPNVNAYDVIVNNRDIKNFGEVTWAAEVDANEKYRLLNDVMREVGEIHQSGIAWGECILQNLIFTKEKQAIMCDPEIRYDEDVPLPEAQARDLMDILLSSCAAMRKAEKETNFTRTVKQLLDNYPDNNIIAVLQGICDAPFTLAQGLAFWNEKLRTGVENKKEYDAILHAIKSYRRDQ